MSRPGMPKKKGKKTAASRVGRSKAPKEDPLLVVATQLTKGAIVSVSSMARELHGKFGDGNCRVRLFGRGRAVLLARQNLVVETEAADYRDTLPELWPHSIEFGWSEPDCRCGESVVAGPGRGDLRTGGRRAGGFCLGTRPSRMDPTASCLTLICMCRWRCHQGLAGT